MPSAPLISDVGRRFDLMIRNLIIADPFRMAALRLICSLGLPDCWAAAGFVRNMIWDHLHGFSMSALNDIDVIYFDPKDGGSKYGAEAEWHLCKEAPHQNWQVRNQAVMHIRNGHQPYSSSLDAMSYWPEIETAVAVRLLSDGTIDLCAPFGVTSLQQGFLTANPKSSSEIFKKRVQDKCWLQRWPLLKITAQQGDAPERFAPGDR